jgi:hypothetical protein
MLHFDMEEFGLHGIPVQRGAGVPIPPLYSKKEYFPSSQQ